MQIPCQSHGGSPTNPIGALMQIPCQSHGGSLANPIGILYKTFGILHKPMTNHPCEAPASFSATSCSGLGVAKGFLALPQRILTQTPYKSYSNSMGAPCKSLRKPIQIPYKSIQIRWGPLANLIGPPCKPLTNPHRNPIGTPYKPCRSPNTNPIGAPHKSLTNSIQTPYKFLTNPLQILWGSLANPRGAHFKSHRNLLANPLGILHNSLTNHPCEALASFSPTSCTGLGIACLGVAKGFLAMPQRIPTQIQRNPNANPLQILFKSYGAPYKFKGAPYKPHSNPMQTLYKSHRGPMQIPYKSHRDPMGIPYKFCRHPHRKTTQIPYKPFTNPIGTSLQIP